MAIPADLEVTFPGDVAPFSQVVLERVFAFQFQQRADARENLRDLVFVHAGNYEAPNSKHQTLRHHGAIKLRRVGQRRRVEKLRSAEVIREPAERNPFNKSDEPSIRQAIPNSPISEKRKPCSAIRFNGRAVLNVRRLVKLAAITLLWVIVRVSGFCAPLASPLHPVKVCPEPGTAVTVTTVPEAYRLV